MARPIAELDRSVAPDMGGPGAQVSPPGTLSTPGGLTDPHAQAIVLARQRLADAEAGVQVHNEADAAKRAALAEQETADAAAEAKRLADHNALTEARRELRALEEANEAARLEAIRHTYESGVYESILRDADALHSAYDPITANEPAEVARTAFRRGTGITPPPAELWGGDNQTQECYIGPLHFLVGVATGPDRPAALWVRGADGGLTEIADLGDLGALFTQYPGWAKEIRSYGI